MMAHVRKLHALSVFLFDKCTPEELTLLNEIMELVRPSNIYIYILASSVTKPQVVSAVRRAD